MSIKNNKSIDHKPYMDMQAYNKWCKEFNVSRQYHKPTEYYHTDYNYEMIKKSDEYSIIHTLSEMFRRILHAMV